VTLTGYAQEHKSIDWVRREFLNIETMRDIEHILEVPTSGSNPLDGDLIRAYQAAATCMKATYEFSPVSKLKYFYQGKKELEKLIRQQKQVENVYLRLMIQLNVPGFLNYDKNIEEDLAYLHSYLPQASLDKDYKRMMLSGLKESIDDEELKNSLELMALDQYN
jgi:hypothetical protein